MLHCFYSGIFFLLTYVHSFSHHYYKNLLLASSLRRVFRIDIFFRLLGYINFYGPWSFLFRKLTFSEQRSLSMYYSGKIVRDGATFALSRRLEGISLCYNYHAIIESRRSFSLTTDMTYIYNTLLEQNITKHFSQL